MPFRDDPAWPDLLAEAAAAAEQNASGWGRYGIALEDVEFRTEQEASQPAPETPQGVPPEILETITALKDAVREAGRLPEPIPAWIGLGLPRAALGFPFDFEAGGHVCLTGFVSASLVPSPALFAAGQDGALLHVLVSAALPGVGELAKPGEMELLPPAFTCYRIDAVHEDVVVTDEHGRLWRRSVVQATQVAMETGEERPQPVRRGTFTAPAARRWRELGPQRQALILANTWCGSCGAETTMEEPSGRIARGDLVLNGTCRWCGGGVGRVVEGG